MRLTEVFFSVCATEPLALNNSRTSRIFVVSTASLFEQLVGKLCRPEPELCEDFFAGIFPLLIFFDAKKVLRRASAEFDQPFGVDIEASRSLPHRPAVHLLALFAEQPVDKNLGCGGMSGILDHGKRAAAATRVGALFGFGKWADRLTGFQERGETVVTQPDGQGQSAFSKIFAEQPLVAREQQLLGGEPAQEFFTFGLVEKRPRGGAGPRGARIEYADLSFPFRIQ